jgi:hypothetical protein
VLSGRCHRVRVVETFTVSTRAGQHGGNVNPAGRRHRENGNTAGLFVEKGIESGRSAVSRRDKDARQPRHGECSKDGGAVCKSKTAQPTTRFVCWVVRNGNLPNMVTSDSTTRGSSHPRPVLCHTLVTPSRQPPLPSSAIGRLQRGLPGLRSHKAHCTNQGWCRVSGRPVQGQCRSNLPMRLGLTRLAAFHSIAEA